MVLGKEHIILGSKSKSLFTYQSTCNNIKGATAMEQNKEKVKCKVCGNIDEYYDENSTAIHDSTAKHLNNLILAKYAKNKKYFSKNRDGVLVQCCAESLPFENAVVNKVEMCDDHKIKISVKPKQQAKFMFQIQNELKNDDVFIVGIQLAHPQRQFEMNNHPYIFGGDPQILQKKSSVNDDIFVTFIGTDIGLYEMPVMFTFCRKSDNRNIIIIRELAVDIFQNSSAYVPLNYPYKCEDWPQADAFIASYDGPLDGTYPIPKNLKIIFPKGIGEDTLDKLTNVPEHQMPALRIVLENTRALIDAGVTENSYVSFFRHLLWWEEVFARINLRNYNMSDVKLAKEKNDYLLEVPGLAENRPSLLRGDRVYVRAHKDTSRMYEGVIRDINAQVIYISQFEYSFVNYFKENSSFDVRFLMSRMTLERKHQALSDIHKSQQFCRVFPEPVEKQKKVNKIKKFYNPALLTNEEQKSAVEHIVSGTSGKAPYMVFGPPGTGKTMTIVEAIIQLVVRDSTNKILVCTDSNMAADHIAVKLLEYNKIVNISNLIIRANSQSRVWHVLPPELANVSNGTSYETSFPLSNVELSKYRIIVTTLMHSAKYALPRNQAQHELKVSHLFIDEAAQASEPAALVPITGLLRPAGHLVLAGDPRQLGPVVISRDARDRGLGKSLMERLKEDFEDMYTDDPNYITMLIKNFRSHDDILRIPNELFYGSALQAQIPPDNLSSTKILPDFPGGDRAIVFHVVNSQEQRAGRAPSYFNEKELEMMQRYVKALVDTHKVARREIGIIAPYIRQVYKMKNWLRSEEYDDIEVGTVEAFQGKEKKVILVSTVRANCKLLDYDAKYGLGFLVDDKRFNVTVTRAKSKLIIIGNPTCLSRDYKWRKYMELCKEYGSYLGEDMEQLPRSSTVLAEVTKKFEISGLTEALKEFNDNETGERQQ